MNNTRCVSFPFVVALLILCLPGTNVFAASFDCATATTFQEQTICKSPELSHLDQEMATIYQAALSTSPRPEQIKDEQRQWLAIRSQLCADAACIKTSLEYRIRELQSIVKTNPAP